MPDKPVIAATVSHQNDNKLYPDFLEDHHRPRYHFLSPANWLNDPNGVGQWGDDYHLFYQYNPNGPFHGTIHWGHAVSRDLVHWEHLPIALAPTPNSPDEDGCWSGCLVNNQGVPTLMYTGVREGKKYQRPCLATSADNLVTWQKYDGNPVIVESPPGLEVIGFRDHCVWRENNLWYQVIGVGFKEGGGAALLYSSPDLIHWQYLEPLLEGDFELQPEVWECPDFFRLDGNHVLLISSWARKRVIYRVGEYKKNRFYPEYQAELDPGGYFYAPQTFQDKQGRRIMWGWLREGRTVEAQRRAGWSGVMSLPLLLSARTDQRLGISFAPELQQLRGKHYRLPEQVIEPDSFELIKGVSGNYLEIQAVIEPGEAEEVGLCLSCTPDGAEQTRLVYNRVTQRLEIDATRSSLDPENQLERRGGFLPLALNEPLVLHIYLDGSVIEVAANHDFYLSGRIYPTQKESQQVGLFARQGKASFKSLDIWEMLSTR